MIKFLELNLEKNKAIIEKILNVIKQGQPILIFTSSVNKSEIYSKLLDEIKNKTCCFKCKKS